MSAIGDARARLFEAAKSAVPATPWRVFDITPAQITAPTVYIGSHELNEDRYGAAGVYVVSFPVTVVVDGTVRSQVMALDELGEALYRAFLAASVDRLTSRSMNLDTGGVNLRALVISIEMLVAVQSFCAPLLTSTGGT
jgi:hypothetical protein